MARCGGETCVSVNEVLIVNRTEMRQNFMNLNDSEMRQNFMNLND